MGCDLYIYISPRLTLDIFKQVLTYKEEPSYELVDIGLSKGCEYMLAYQKLIVEFVSNYIIVLTIPFYN